MSSPSRTFQSWQTHHMMLFGFCTKQHAEMVVTWSLLFKQNGYTPDELYAASDHLAATEPPRYPTDHMALLTSRLKESRRLKNLDRGMLQRRKLDEEERAKRAPPGLFRKLLKQYAMA